MLRLSVRDTEAKVLEVFERESNLRSLLRYAKKRLAGKEAYVGRELWLVVSRDDFEIYSTLWLVPKEFVG